MAKTHTATTQDTTTQITHQHGDYANATVQANAMKNTKYGA
jgi:hypothetical protein